MVTLLRCDADGDPGAHRERRLVDACGGGEDPRPDGDGGGRLGPARRDRGRRVLGLPVRPRLRPQRPGGRPPVRVRGRHRRRRSVQRAVPVRRAGRLPRDDPGVRVQDREPERRRLVRLRPLVPGCRGRGAGRRPCLRLWLLSLTTRVGAAMRVAVVGSGPAGFYAAGALLSADPPAEVDLIERLPTPWGLVRLGVAPDHPKLKTVSRAFERIADQPGFRFLGNVEVGRDLLHEDLVRLYDAVIYAVGAQTDRRLGIPGEDLPGSWAATEFVAWYNGHPDYQQIAFDLSV